MVDGITVSALKLAEKRLRSITPPFWSGTQEIITAVPKKGRLNIGLEVIALINSMIASGLKGRYTNIYYIHKFMSRTIADCCEYI